MAKANFITIFSLNVECHKMRNLLIILPLLTSLQSSSQVNTICVDSLNTSNDTMIYSFVEKPAEYKGGINNFYKDFIKEIKYPSNQKEIQTKLFLGIVIDSSGSIINACIIRPLYSNHLTLLEQECLNVVMKLDNWNPGKNEGVNVTTKLTFPLSINLK